MLESAINVSTVGSPSSELTLILLNMCLVLCEMFWSRVWLRRGKTSEEVKEISYFLSVFVGHLFEFHRNHTVAVCFGSTGHLQFDGLRV